VTSMEPRVIFANLNDRGIAELGLDAAEAAFQRDVQLGLTNGDSLIITVGAEDDGPWQELGRRAIGPDAEQFAANIDPDTGKLATALNFEMNSVDAYAQYRGHVPEGPQRYTGGVYYAARVKTADRGWLSRTFAGAASGVQGHLDMATVYAALTHMAAAWAFKMQALHGKAS
jgi:hypothetical protein